MEKEFVTYDQAVALKELGFNEDTFQRFLLPNMDDFCKHPLKQQVFRWFREKYGLVGLVEVGSQEYGYKIFNEKKDNRVHYDLDYNGTYEEAENACIDKLIEILKQQNNG